MRGCGTLPAALWWLSQPEAPHKTPKEFVCSGHTGLLLGNLSRLSLLWCLRATSCFQAACSHRLQTLNSLVPRLSAAHLLPQGVPWDPSAHRSPCAALSFCFPRLGTANLLQPFYFVRRACSLFHQSLQPLFSSTSKTKQIRRRRGGE